MGFVAVLSYSWRVFLRFCLKAQMDNFVQEALWFAYGPQVQQAWRDQLVPDSVMPDFDPGATF